MKKNFKKIFLIGCILCTVSSYGQYLTGQNINHKEVKKKEKKRYVDLSFSYSSFGIITEDANTSNSSGYGLSLHIGRKFNNYFKIYTGLEFENDAVSYPQSATLTDYTENDNLLYLTAPLRALLTTNTKKKVGLLAEAGIDFSVLVLSEKSSYDGVGAAPYSQSMNYNSNIIKPYIGIGMFFGAGKNNPGAAHAITLFYSNSVSNIYADENGDVGSYNNFGLKVVCMTR